MGMERSRWVKVWDVECTGGGDNGETVRVEKANNKKVWTSWTLGRVSGSQESPDLTLTTAGFTTFGLSRTAKLPLGASGSSFKTGPLYLESGHRPQPSSP